MKRNIVLINLAAAMLWMSMYTYVPTLPAYAASLGANVVMIGIISGSYGIMQIILRIPLGLISDRKQKDRLLLIVGFIVLTISAVLFLFAHNAVALVFARATAGAAAAWWVILTAAYSRYYDEKTQVKAQGILSASSNAGKMVAGLICALVANASGHYATFIVSLALAIIGLIFAFSLKKSEIAHPEPPTLKEQLLLIKNKELIVFCILGILSQILCFGVATTFTEVVAEQQGADSIHLGMLTMVFFLAVALASFFVGSRAYRKIGGKNSLAIAFAVGAVSCIPAFYTQNLAMIYFCQVLSGICYGITMAALAGFALKAVSANQRGAASGIFQSLFSIGIFAGPVIVGFLIDRYSFNVAYWAMFVLMMISAVLCYILIPKRYDKMT